MGNRGETPWRACPGGGSVNNTAGRPGQIRDGAVTVSGRGVWIRAIIVWAINAECRAIPRFDIILADVRHAQLVQRGTHAAHRFALAQPRDRNQRRQPGCRHGVMQQHGQAIRRSSVTG